MKTRDRRLRTIGLFLMVPGLLVLLFGFLMAMSFETLPKELKGPKQVERRKLAGWLQVAGFVPMFAGLSLAGFASLRSSWANDD